MPDSAQMFSSRAFCSTATGWCFWHGSRGKRRRPGATCRASFGGSRRGGEVRGGRFVKRHAGEQFALPKAVPLLRRLRQAKPRGEEICLSACDPLNLLGIVTPGARVAAIPSDVIPLGDGLPVAVLEGGRVQLLEGGGPLEEARVAAPLRRGPGALDGEPRSRYRPGRRVTPPRWAPGLCPPSETPPRTRAPRLALRLGSEGLHDVGLVEGTLERVARLGQC